MPALNTSAIGLGGASLAKSGAKHTAYGVSSIVVVEFGCWKISRRSHNGSGQALRKKCNGNSTHPFTKVLKYHARNPHNRGMGGINKNLLPRLLSNYMSGCTGTERDYLACEGRSLNMAGVAPTHT
ncbi:hypothetical protein BD779DRAFT_1474343 [Infundibulicybe gibba]|nr:hypothetical protein BD779DRAFT_1474343 [Infundibulicybe gibba]